MTSQDGVPCATRAVDAQVCTGADGSRRVRASVEPNGESVNTMTQIDA